MVTVKRPRRLPVWHRAPAGRLKRSLAYDAEAARPADLFTCRKLDL